MARAASVLESCPQGWACASAVRSAQSGQLAPHSPLPELQARKPRPLTDLTDQWKSQALFFFLFLFIYLPIYLSIYILFLAVLGLRCCAQAFSSCGERGLLFVAVCRLLIEVASLAAEHGLQACGLQQLWHVGSVVVVCWLSCSVACGIFPDQGWNPSPLHWQADS